MKKIITCFLAGILYLSTIAQSISPSTDANYCPGVTTTFVVTVPGGAYYNPTAVGISNTAYPNSQAVQLYGGGVTMTSDGINTYFTFQGYFYDYAAPQGLQLSFRDGTGSTRTYTFTYLNITSFNPADSRSRPSPSPSSIQATACESPSFNISFPNVNYYNNNITPARIYGPITAYQYLLPVGWQLGTAISDGSTWLPGGSSVTVTSNLTNGDGGSVQIRAAPCSATANLTQGPVASIPISRPAPVLTITGSNQVCSPPQNYDISTLPAGATIVWTVSANLQILGSNTGTTLQVQQAAGTISGAGTITANVTLSCGTVTTVTKTVNVGATPVTITYNPQGPCSGPMQTWYLSIPADIATNYQWTVTRLGTNSSIYLTTPYSNATFADVTGGGTVTLTYTDQCGNAKTDGVTLYSSCPPSFSAYTIAPNPATNTITITSNNEMAAGSRAARKSTKIHVQENNAVIEQIRIFDINGKLKKTLHYSTKVSQLQVNVGDLAPGFYLLEISNRAGITHEKIVIQR